MPAQVTLGGDNDSFYGNLSPPSPLRVNPALRAYNQQVYGYIGLLDKTNESYNHAVRIGAALRVVEEIVLESEGKDPTQTVAKAIVAVTTNLREDLPDAEQILSPIRKRMDDADSGNQLDRTPAAERRLDIFRSGLLEAFRDALVAGGVGRVKLTRLESDLKGSPLTTV